MPKLELVERGIRRLKSRYPPQRIRLPITPVILRQLQSLWSPRAGEFEVVTMWAACCTAFFGFFRIGEITVDGQAVHGRGTSHCVSVGDVAVDDRRSPSVLKIHLRHSRVAWREGCALSGWELEGNPPIWVLQAECE